MNLIQLFDPATSTYTYFVIDQFSREAVVIDPVDEQLERDLSVIAEHQLKLKWIIETHAHADHITSAWRLAEHTGAKTAVPELCHINGATQLLKDDDILEFGAESIRAIHTPGHTAGSMSFQWRDVVFTGDALLINGCGRTDFQSGSAKTLYESITEKLFTLPDATIVYPGHDYNGQTQSTIGNEKQNNPRLAGKTLEEFIAIMAALKLPKPARIDQAVPANLHLGIRHDAQSGPSPDLGYAGDISAQQAYDWWQSQKVELVDVRSTAELEWVGFVPQATHIAWKQWPEMLENPRFDEQLNAFNKDKAIAFFCRSGVRAVASAQRATALGYTAYNILGGFEGELNDNAQRKHIDGWCASDLPWRQS